MKRNMILILIMASMINLACVGGADKVMDPVAEKESSTVTVHLEDSSASMGFPEKQNKLMEPVKDKHQNLLEESEKTAEEKEMVLIDESLSTTQIFDEAKNKVEHAKETEIIRNEQSNEYISEDVEQTNQVEIFESEEGAKAQKEQVEDVVKEELTVVMDHGSFDQLLRQFVDASGNVDYAAFKKSEGLLDAYLTLLSENTIESSWSKNEKLAYWINAYNAFTLKLILKNYPVKSIMDLHNGKPWDVKWIKLGDETYSLNQIENEIIRPQFKDARIHFAVNCAAKSCPPLANKAYTAANVQQLMEARAKSFIQNRKYNQLSENKVTVSKIFDWYGEDFNNVVEYLSIYAGNVEIKADAKINFNEYDWTLNGR